MNHCCDTPIRLFLFETLLSNENPRIHECIATQKITFLSPARQQFLAEHELVKGPISSSDFRGS